MPIGNPLTEAHLADINKGLEAVASAEQQIDLATRAGLNVTTYAQQVADAKAKLLALKRVYFPGA